MSRRLKVTIASAAACIAVLGAAASGAVTTAEDAAGGCDGVKNGRWGFHVASGEQDPWWQVDLGKPCRLDRVVIFNRTDSTCSPRTSRIRVLVAAEKGQQPAEVYQHDGTTFLGVKENKPLVVALRDKNVTARIVRLQVEGATGSGQRLGGRLLGRDPRARAVVSNCRRHGLAGRPPLPSPALPFPPRGRRGRRQLPPARGVRRAGGRGAARLSAPCHGSRAGADGEDDHPAVRARRHSPLRTPGFCCGAPGYRWIWSCLQTSTSRPSTIARARAVPLARRPCSAASASFRFSHSFE